MRTRTARRALTVALLAATTGAMTAGPAAAETETRIGFASTGLDGTDPRTGRTLHSGFDVFDPPDENAFGVTDVFVGGVVTGGGEGIIYECMTEDRVRARLDALSSAFAAGVLRVDCFSPDGLPDRSGYVVVALSWRGTGPVERHVFDRGDGCTEYMDVRGAHVTGRIVLIVPGVAVAPLANEDPAESELRQQRIVCSS
ncbi:hypothetical protein [Blastococcus saxobsidens]|uniref:Secreted protein n=1 Tax=Blastococcus saxobsidens (strain DD2) TaxID=1146883 RepID=H6RLI2_BLASD|nr:hypothetical protein [Blastococcus saxobsidens]CCG02508.1 exported protein of unknown function [Blastococcus saxobsidens DD2]